MSRKTESINELQTLLKRANLPSAWAAKRLDITTGYWWRVTSGRAEPSEKVVKRVNSLCEALKQSKVLAG